MWQFSGYSFTSCKTDPIIAEKICVGPKNAKYTNHSIQNAILDIMKEMVLEQIKEELHEAKLFTVLADESKDVSKKEQVVIAVRYCHQNAIHKNVSELLRHMD